MNWFSKHADSIAVIGVVIGTMIWMNTQFNQIQQDMGSLKKDMIALKEDVQRDLLSVKVEVGLLKVDVNLLKVDVNSLKTDVAVMKAVMLMKSILPPELAKCEREEK